MDLANKQDILWLILRRNLLNGEVMRTKALIFLILTVLLSLSIVPVHAQSVPPLPHAFYGDVTINGQGASVGTVVSAKAGGVACGSCVVKVAGQYGDRSKADYLAVTCTSIHSGDTINFYVNGVYTGQTGVFQSGEITELNLSVTIATPAVTTNTATSVTTTSATLNGNLSSLGAASSVTVAFEWGTTTGYGNETTAQIMSSTGSFSTILSQLNPAITYYFRAKVVGEITTYGSDKSFITMSAATAGGGTTPVISKIDDQGVTTQSINVESEDGVCRLTMDKGTKLLDKEGSPLSRISITETSRLPSLPENTSIIGVTYDFGPDGATFNPPINLKFSYTLSDKPENVNEDGLVITYYDDDTATWIGLESTVNAATNTVTASISHFTTFGILGYKILASTAAPAVPAAPAIPEDFTLSSLTIFPDEAAPDETVTISVLIANIGGQSASYRVILKIGGEVEAISSVTIGADVTREVSFTTAKNTAGTYTVDINGLTGSFTVREAQVVQEPSLPPPPAATPNKATINWPVIGGIITAIVVISLLIFVRIRRRAYG
ncbi:hypothetical protein ACFLUU_04290 [Chloroflexota bacterium]